MCVSPSAGELSRFFVRFVPFFSFSLMLKPMESVSDLNDATICWSRGQPEAVTLLNCVTVRSSSDPIWLMVAVLMRST